MNTPQPRPLTGVIFDLDGTLVDSAPDIQGALHRFLATRNRRAVTLEETKAAIGDGATALVQRVLALTGGVPDNLAAEAAAFREIYSNMQADPAQIYPHVIETLTTLQQQGIALGLCTNKPEQAMRKLLAAIDLQRYFGAAAGGDTYAVCKPHPDHLAGVIDELGLAPGGCVMVGDSANDYLAAERLGIPCVLVDYGYGGYGAGDAATLPAAALITSMAALPAALRQLGFAW